ncbi:MAG TPA: hypothetical protein VLX11_00525 [Candidatus Acidoferrales bacterium]|nr:hypothetical protein [Candidatus Acidoferrales bacterium]
MKRALVASLVILWLASSAQSADRMRIAYSSISGAYVGIWVALDAGFLSKKDWKIRSFLFLALRSLLRSPWPGTSTLHPSAAGP